MYTYMSYLRHVYSHDQHVMEQTPQRGPLEQVPQIDHGQKLLLEFLFTQKRCRKVNSDLEFAN